MWQVYLFLANEYQGRERQEARRTHRARRWSIGRHRASARSTAADRDTTVGARRAA
jgi:hypothetical protein